MSTLQKHPRHKLPILEGILPVNRSYMIMDIVAGITLAALAIPEVMGYTKIAGMPVVTGLYTLLIPMALFSVFGSSRRLVVGADSATAAILAAGLVSFAAIGSPEYVALAGLLAIISGLFVLIARIIQIGFLADFLSKTVLIGFLTGVGIQVAIGQISGMLGIPDAEGSTVQKLVADFQQFSQASFITMGISILTILVILGMRRIARKIPGALIAVVGMIILSWALNLEAKGVSVLGIVPGGVPKISLPQVNINFVPKLLATAFSMFIVIIAQSAATSRAYAAKYNERFNQNRDLIGLSLANIGAGLSGTFVVNGSPTKTQIVVSAGGRSQLAQITTTLIVLLVLLFLTEPLQYLPNAVLAAVVFLIGLELVDFNGMHRILAERPWEFWVAFVTAVTVIFIGVEEGIILAIVLSLVVHTRHGYWSRNTVLVEQSGHLRPVPVAQATQVVPGLILYRFNHSLYYANSELFATQIMELFKTGPVPVAWFCIDMVAVDDIDFTAYAVLRQVFQQANAHGSRLVFSEVSDFVFAELERSGIVDLAGRDAFFSESIDVIETYRKNAGSSIPDGLIT